MKLSSRTGMIKRADMDISEAIFEEFGQEESIIRINKPHYDIEDEHHSVQKAAVKMQRRQEVNRSDGNKIYVGQIGIRESEISEGEVGNRPTVITAGRNRSYISSWEVNDFDEHRNKFSVFDHEQTGQNEPFFEESNDSVHSLKEAKGMSKEIIENANKEALSIIEEAQTRANEIMNQATMEGYQAGFAQVNSEIEILRKIQVEMNKLKEELLQNTESEIIELIKIIAAKLFTNGMVLDANVLKDIVGRAINEASRIGNLKVYLNPSDLDKLKKLWRESELEFNGQKIQLASNSDVQPGGVYVEGDYGSVDGRIATQLDSVMELITDIHLEEQEV
jgi:flagellar assembly protein FliH